MVTGAIGIGSDGAGIATGVKLQTAATSLQQSPKALHTESQKHPHSVLPSQLPSQVHSLFTGAGAMGAKTTGAKGAIGDGAVGTSGCGIFDDGAAGTTGAIGEGATGVAGTGSGTDWALRCKRPSVSRRIRRAVTMDGSSLLL